MLFTSSIIENNALLNSVIGALLQEKTIARTILYIGGCVNFAQTQVCVNFAHFRFFGNCGVPNHRINTGFGPK